MADEKILDRARKLHAMANDKATTEAEAQAFASKLQSLMTEHRLSMTDVEYQQHAEQPIVRTVYHPNDYLNKDGRKIKRQVCEDWEIQLAEACGRAHACSCAFYQGINSVAFYGVEQDGLLAAQAFSYMARAAEQIAQREYVRFFYECKRAGQVHRARGYKASFLAGFVARLQERLREDMEQMYQGQSSAGIMRVGQDLARAVKAKNEQVTNTFESKAAPIRNLQGLKDGQRVANEQQLKPTGQLPSK